MAGRVWDTGLVRPYRPAPGNFRDVFLRLGWSKEIREHFNTNDRCIARWIEECGGDELRTARSEITGKPLRPYLRSGRAKAYVLGRRFRNIADWPTRDPRFWEVGLLVDDMTAVSPKTKQA